MLQQYDLVPGSTRQNIDPTDATSIWWPFADDGTNTASPSYKLVLPGTS